jgi:hypothetical protein
MQTAHRKLEKYIYLTVQILYQKRLEHKLPKIGHKNEYANPSIHNIQNIAGIVQGKIQPHHSNA